MLYFPYFLIDITQKGEKYCAKKIGAAWCAVGSADWHRLRGVPANTLKKETP